MNCLYRISKLNTSIIKRNFLNHSERSYCRWTHRRPVRIINPEEPDEKTRKIYPIDKEVQFQNEMKIKWRHQVEKDSSEEQEEEQYDRPKRQKRVLFQQHSKRPPTTDMLQTVIDSEGNFIYTKMNNNDSRVGTLLTTVKSQKEKTKKDLILLEGKTLIKDALEAGCALKYLLFSRKPDVEDLKPFLPKMGSNLYKMPYREMQMWSDLTTCPGIMALFRRPQTETYKSENPIPLTIFCDNIREPGNLGSILRVAAAVGCEKLYLSTGCVNLWDTKVTRSASGAHFRLQIHTNKSIEDVVQPEISTEGSKLFLADSTVVNSLSNESSLKDLINDVPIVPYYSVNFSENKANFLVIGGETLGLSEQVYSVAKELNGVRLNIPMRNGVDSLNTGTALGIISFEIVKQLSTQ